MDFKDGNSMELHLLLFIFILILYILLGNNVKFRILDRSGTGSMQLWMKLISQVIVRAWVLNKHILVFEPWVFQSHIKNHFNLGTYTSPLFFYFGAMHSSDFHFQFLLHGQRLSFDHSYVNFHMSYVHS